MSTPRVYFDHAATTPPDPDVIEAMLPYLGGIWHNPSSIYVEAQEAAKALDRSRAHIASLVGAADPEEIVFTSGGSESDNLALRGVLAASTRRGTHVVSTSVEPHAILDPPEPLEREGLAEVTLLDRKGGGEGK